MKKLLALLCLLAAVPAYAMDCGNLGEWLGSGCQRVADTFDKGTRDLYVTGYAWHDPNTYTEEKRAELNSNAWGLGFGKHVTDENGNQDIVYGMVFADSHKDPEINVGYGRLWFWNVAGPVSAGLGYTVGLVSRKDIYGGIPIPLALPLASIKVDKVSILATFIPKLNGGINNGNVAFFFSRIELQ